MSQFRGNQILRQWNLLCACECEQGLSVTELVSLLRTGRRTIYRDISILKRCGANLESLNNGSVVRYRSRQPFFKHQEPVT